jgi:hypothetical protein
MNKDTEQNSFSLTKPTEIFSGILKKCRKPYEWWRKWEIGKDIAPI